MSGSVRSSKSFNVIASVDARRRCQKIRCCSAWRRSSRSQRAAKPRLKRRFLDDGRIEIDSNVVERTIRPLALTRKNALFAGSDAGAEHWAVIASLVETCKLNAVEPYHYLADVITRIAGGHRQSLLDDLLPWNYPATSQLKAVA
jgi:IS66 C-terminal element/Transposase IS66 family